MGTPQQVLEFWFGRLTPQGATATDRSALWWGKDPSQDEAIRQRFGDTVDAGSRGELENWIDNAEGQLALILCFDQFPRNMYRDTPRAFALDRCARYVCLRGIEQGSDKALALIQRVFYFMPLEHSEDREMQAQSVELFRGLLRLADVADKPAFRTYLQYAERHREIIDRFGRFPHRNKILGRASTVEELAFLRQPSSSF